MQQPLLFCFSNISPANYSPFLWSEADRNVYTGSGSKGAAAVNNDPVAQWDDLGTNTYHWQQFGSNPARPSFATNIQNSLPGIYFSGSNWMATASSVQIGTFTDFWVFKLTGTAGMIGEHSVDANTNAGHFLYATTVSAMCVRRGTTNSVRDYNVNWAVDNATKLVIQEFDGTEAGHTLRINGSDITTSRTVVGDSGDPGTGLSAAAKLHLMARNAGASLFSTGYLFARLIFTPKLSSTNKTIMENYLNSKWSVY